MVERLAATGANALELIDRLNDEDTSAAVHALIDRVTELHKVGALDTVCDTLMLVHAMRNALTDNMVERLFTFFEQMINTVGNEAMANWPRTRGSRSRRRPRRPRGRRRAAACSRCCRCCRSPRPSAASPSCSPSAKSCRARGPVAESAFRE